MPHWRRSDAIPLERFRQARILIVDDESASLRVLCRILERAGYSEVTTSTNSHRLLPLYQEIQPDLVLLDLHMPGLDGFALLESLRKVIPAGVYLPILMLTGDDRFEVKQRALSDGARDFLIKPYDVVEVVLRIHNLLETRFLHLLLQEQNQDLEQKVTARTVQLEQSQVEVLERLAAAAEFRDDDTGKHTQRVAIAAAALGRSLGLSDNTVSLLRRAAPLHDVGKIGIPDRVLLKPGKLDSDELKIMRTHTTIGARMLSGGRSDLIRMAERIAWCHHEWWDGSGYPRSLAGQAIPIEARVIAVADFFDALTHDRPYRVAWGVERVTAEIGSLSGRHFDPEVVRAFLGLALDPDPEDLDAAPLG